MTDLVVLGGSGDAYLVAALSHAVPNARLVVSSRLAAVVDLFPGVAYRVDDALVAHAQDHPEFQREHDNHLGNPVYYVHPCFHRSRVRVDKLTTKPDASQADMYRMLLWLPPDTPLTLPRVPAAEPIPGRVTVIVDSTSWPNTQPAFWIKLVAFLRSAGWNVAENDKRWSLAELLAQCAASEWVIGPQCGVMSILVTGRFPCRKTLATPNLDENRRPEYLADQTFPYGYVTKFSGEDHDVEEFKISDDDHDDVIWRIASGVNAQRLRPHDPTPVVTVAMPLSPGDFLDRLAVLTVKRARLPLDLAAAQEREYQRYVEARRQLPLPASVRPIVDTYFDALVEHHAATYELLERLVPAALAGDLGVAADHAAAVRLNRVRVGLKRAIDEICHAPYGEVKSYHG